MALECALLGILGYGEEDRDREAYAEDGGTGDVEWSRVKILLGLKGGEVDDNLVDNIAVAMIVPDSRRNLR